MDETRRTPAPAIGISAFRVFIGEDYNGELAGSSAAARPLRILLRTTFRKAVTMAPPPPIIYGGGNSGDGNYGDGDEEENQSAPN
jgi:hypothetical protein